MHPFHPETSEMYADGFCTYVDMTDLTEAYYLREEQTWAFSRCLYRCQ